ncbi:hypothetical protein OPU71_10770 [Niveibacterium sp. 24ML]|uniref:hypothetical protein n=1 Tax=Niveibacterium sp. 24ML TaxID=2985512 RepID=UPI002270B134|nr:hypothetical protein [Niveibacterium sp. 24ML]MCX9156604.1 hypothetical protein [Niveibacterium sp. 24ML]
MYYMMHCPDPEVGYLAMLDYDFSEDPDPLRDWMSADRFDEPPPLPVRVTVAPRPNSVIGEMWQVPLPIMSKRLLETLTKGSVSNIDSYPLVFEMPDGSIRQDTHVAFNLIGKISTVAQRGYIKGGNELLGGVRLNEEAIGDALMFRLAESVNAIVVHDSIKAAIQAAGIDTLQFIAPESWTG